MSSTKSQNGSVPCESRSAMLEKIAENPGITYGEIKEYIYENNLLSFLKTEVDHNYILLNLEVRGDIIINRGKYGNVDKDKWKLTIST